MSARVLNKYFWETNGKLDAGAARRLEERFDIPPAAARFLVARSYAAPESAGAYLFPEDTPPNDPFLFSQMESAVGTMTRSLARGHRILIHGDYDVDGICGTGLLYENLRGMVPHVFRFVPDRRKDGYGVATRAVDWAIENHIDLFVAVDCGTSDGDSIARLEEAGIPSIICDHHELPVDRAVHGILLNPSNPEETYPFRGLCGAGVAYKFMQALATRGVLSVGTPEASLDLVALATVGDLAPLIGENRHFVRAGLRLLSDSPRPSIDALRSVAGVRSGRITSTHIGFTLAPRINAPGRVDNPKVALELLCETDRTRALALASVLEGHNDRRRELTDTVTEEAISTIRSASGWESRGGFVLAAKNWDEGVLGIAASRVVDESGRPAVLISLDGELAKGSGRSVPGVHLKEQLDGCREYLTKFGGHAQAVGLSLDHSKVEPFIAALGASLDEAMVSLPKQPRLRIDTDLGIDECTLDLVAFLEGCEPFGYGNRRAVWRIPRVSVATETRFVGNGHLKLFFRDEHGRRGEAIAFGWGETRDIPPESLHGRTVDLAVTLRRGEYRDRVYPEARLRDVREHGSQTECG